MSTKAKSRFGRPVATNEADIGAFEDRLNQEFADQARAEWLKRVAATGLSEEDWTDITAEEMAAVEAAFVPQERATHLVTPDPPPPVPTQATSSKTTAGSKSANVRNPYAATVEDEPTPPGAWEMPSKSAVPARGMTGRTRSETPILTRVIPTPHGSVVDSQKANGGMPTPDSLWGMHMNKQSAPAEPEPTESLWEMHALKTHSADGSQSSDSRWSPYQSTPPTSAPTSKFPTPELLWEINRGNSPRQPPTPAQPAAFPLTNKLREKLMAEAVDPFPPQVDPEPDDIWEPQTKTGKKNGASFQRPASVKPPPSAPPVSRTPAPANTPVPPKAPTTSKPGAPSKLSMSVSDSLWNTPATLGHPSLHTMVSELPTPVSSTYTGNYNYISPVFFEMEDDGFPRQDDPLPESAVEETIRRFHATAAEMDIELRRNLLSGTLDESELEQLLDSHITTMEHNARKVLEEWNGAREAVLEERRIEEQRRVEEQRRKVLEEQRKRQAEAKKLVGKKKGKWSLPIIEDVAEEPPIVEPPVSGKRKPVKKGAVKTQPSIMEESFRAKAATPALEQEEESTDDLWQPTPKAPAQAAAAKSMFSFFGKSSPTPAPGTPVPTPWPQTQAPPTRALTSKPSASKNSFAPVSKASKPAPDRGMTPWELMQAYKQETAPVQQETDPWGEENTDESEEGMSWTQMAMDTARGGVASAWDTTLAAVGGERPGTTAPRPATSTAPGRENLWGGGDMFARSESRAPWGEEPSSADPRFSTWKPPRREEPATSGDGSTAKKMADLAFQNLFDVAGDGEDPDDMMNAMSMYTKAMATSTRKRGGSNAHR